jgi:hypothetical protein
LGARTRRALITLAAALSAVATGLAQSSQPPPPQRTAPFTFDGVGLASDFKTVAAKYKNSQPDDGYVRLSPADIHDHISSIEVSGSGAARRVRIGFELDGPKGPIYPTCAAIEQRVAKAFGKPDEIRRFSEEATPRADRIWKSAAETMTVLCFQQRSQWLAEAVMITPSR